MKVMSADSMGVGGNRSTKGSEWSKEFSKKHQTHYWYNAVSLKSVWEDPNPVEHSVQHSGGAEESEEQSGGISKKRKVCDEASSSSASALSNPPSSSAHPATSTTRQETSTKIPETSTITPEISITRPDIAIIVPYRDLHTEQKRKQQLDRFIPAITEFMESSSLTGDKKTKSYRIYIIEQSNDGRKFNRGKLLNIGFKIACAEGCQAAIFHDVDLIPSAGKYDRASKAAEINRRYHRYC